MEKKSDVTGGPPIRPESGAPDTVGIKKGGRLESEESLSEGLRHTTSVTDEAAAQRIWAEWLLFGSGEVVWVENSDGMVEAFEPTKIFKSLIKELGMAIPVAEKITRAALAKIRATGLQRISAPHIREIVCAELSGAGAEMAAYRKKYTRAGLPIYDLEELLGDNIHENANQDLNPESTHTWIADKVVEQYVALAVLPETAREYHLSGRMHIHMMRYFDRPFCAEWDLRMILLYGLPPGGWTPCARSRPAKNALVAATHAAKWLGIIQGEFSGGQGYDNFTVFLAPYLRGLPYKASRPGELDILQVAQCFVFEANQIFAARGGQPPFSSIGCVPNVPDILRDVDAIGPGGQIYGKYGDFEEECRLFFRALVDVYAEGDADGKMFAFPKHEIKITRRGIRDFEEEYRYCVMKETCKMGSPYFLNGLAEWMPEEVHSQCCRIILTPEGMKKFCREPGLFDYKTHFVSMGSVQSVSINLPRAAYNSLEKRIPIEEELADVFHAAEDVLILKWNRIKKSLASTPAYLPLCSTILPERGAMGAQPLFELQRQSLSIGFVGLNEAVHALCGEELHSKEGHSLGVTILRTLSALCDEASARHQIKFSLWEQPAESTAATFAEKDLRYMPAYAKRYAQGVSSIGSDLTKPPSPYYSNSAHLRYDAPIPLSSRISLQADFHEIVRGGVITHIWLGEQHPDPEALWILTKKIAENSKTAYFSYSFDFSACKNCGRFHRGVLLRCPDCGADTKKLEYYAKITGYYSRISRWNAAKKDEWTRRHRYEI